MPRTLAVQECVKCSVGSPRGFTIAQHPVLRGNHPQEGEVHHTFRPHPKGFKVRSMEPAPLPVDRWIGTQITHEWVGGWVGWAARLG